MGSPRRQQCTQGAPHLPANLSPARGARGGTLQHLPCPGAWTGCIRLRCGTPWAGGWGSCPRTTARAEPSAHRPERPCSLPHTHTLPRLLQLGPGLRGSRHHSHFQRGLGGSEEAHSVRWELGPPPFLLQGAEGEQPGHSNPLSDKPGRKPWRLPRGRGCPRTPQPLHSLALLLPTTPARDRASPSLTSLQA